MTDEEIREFVSKKNYINEPIVTFAWRVLKDRNHLRTQEKIEELTKVINKASESSDSLGNRLWVLNLILVVATAVGAIATALIAWKTFQ